LFLSGIESPAMSGSMGNSSIGHVIDTIAVLPD
jgi:hypothetical protein